MVASLEIKKILRAVWRNSWIAQLPDVSLHEKLYLYHKLMRSLALLLTLIGRTLYHL